MINAKLRKRGKRNNRGFFYRISAWVHLWFGLVSGLIMVIVCLTGCIWVFHDEIEWLLNSKERVAYQPSTVVQPSQLIKLADSVAPGKRPNYATYQHGRPIHLALGEGRSGNTIIKVHPYNGTVISTHTHSEGEYDFFRFILNGHRFLWLPPAIGRPIVNYGTLVFVILLITGIVLWWPKKWNRAARQKSFTIKWGATFKRVNYDLHNVPGFYSMLFLIAISLTGMVYGIEWYSKGLYWITSGGDRLPTFSRPISDSLQAGKMFTPSQVMDNSWRTMVAAHPDAKGFYYSFANPSRASSSIQITVYPTPGKYYNSRTRAFDQHTGRQLETSPLYATSYEKASGAMKLRKMNYDIHVGSILGFPGKVMAFFAALIGASLPVTGFLVWWGKRKKRKLPSEPMHVLRKHATPEELVAGN